jgi:hypothetical protein
MSDRCWRCLESPGPREYVALFGYYLGDGHLARHRASHVLRVSCDAKFPGIIEDVSTLIRPVAGAPKRYEYPRWQFVNASPEIRGWCCDALDLAGVPWRQSAPRTISVSTRTGVARLDELIGPKA